MKKSWNVFNVNTFPVRKLFAKSWRVDSNFKSKHKERKEKNNISRSLRFNLNELQLSFFYLFKYLYYKVIISISIEFYTLQSIFDFLVDAGELNTLSPGSDQCGFEVALRQRDFKAVQFADIWYLCNLKRRATQKGKLLLSVSSPLGCHIWHLSGKGAGTCF